MTTNNANVAAMSAPSSPQTVNELIDQLLERLDGDGEISVPVTLLRTICKQLVARGQLIGAYKKLLTYAADEISLNANDPELVAVITNAIKDMNNP